MESILTCYYRFKRKICLVYKGSGREYWTLLFTCRLHLVVSSCSTVACAYRAVACQGLLISEDPCPTLAMYVLDVQVVYRYWVFHLGNNCMAVGCPSGRFTFKIYWHAHKSYVTLNFYINSVVWNLSTKISITFVAIALGAAIYAFWSS